MALDRQLSRNFWLHEFSGWQNATEYQVGQLTESVARVLQPIRSAFDPTPLYPTSWLEWGDGTARTGAHAFGALDFVMGDGRTREAFDWASRYVVPAGFVGRLIYEPERSATEGQRQGEHVHVAPRTAMTALGKPDTVQVLVETTEGNYSFYQAAAGLGVSVLALAALFFFPCETGRGGENCIPTLGLATP